MKTRQDLVNEFAIILNKACRENASDTPDFMLAEHLIQCLEAFECGVRAREEWYGRKVKDLTCGEN